MVETLYHRRALAARLSKLIVEAAVGVSGSAVFMVAPPRTGKTTFICEDLLPALEAAGAIALYADVGKDPVLAIEKAVLEAVGHNGGGIPRPPCTQKFNVSSLSFSLEKIGLGKEVDLATALMALSREAQKVITLVIDEAQFAMRTDDGLAALFALKAARDELNSSKLHGLCIVCIGSDRDKLAMLRNSKDQPFFGAAMVQLPTLDQDFVDWFCANLDLPCALNPAEVFQLFKECSYRPELLGSASEEVRLDVTIGPESTPARFAELVRAQAEELKTKLRKAIQGLTPIQFAVLRVMSVKGDDYAPYEAPTKALYVKAMEQAGIAASEIKAEAPDVRQALTALQERKLVWRALRDVYAVNEHMIVDLLRSDGLLEGLS